MNKLGKIIGSVFLAGSLGCAVYTNWFGQDAQKIKDLSQECSMLKSSSTNPNYQNRYLNLRDEIIKTQEDKVENMNFWLYLGMIVGCFTFDEMDKHIKRYDGLPFNH